MMFALDGARRMNSLRLLVACVMSALLFGCSWALALSVVPMPKPPTTRSEEAHRHHHSGITTKPFLLSALSLATAVTVMTSSLPVSAAFDPSIYQGDYRDPLHPLCERHVAVDRDNRKWYYTGTDVGPKGMSELHGCSKAEIAQYGLRQGAFEGIILKDGRLSVGDGVHEAVWEPARKSSAADTTIFGYEDVDGIRFDDHNKWVVMDQSRVAVERNGKYVVRSKGLGYQAVQTIFVLYIGFSTLAGVKGLYDGINKRRRAEGK